MTAGPPSGVPGTNWARNYVYRAQRLRRPTSLAQLREILASATALRVVGSRHSFNDIADSAADMVSLDALETPIELSADGAIVTVGAATRYGALVRFLAAHRLAVANLASLPHISVAGAVSTGTHGSGDHNGSLSTSVRGVQLLLASGELRWFSRSTDGDDFPGMVVALGALGVITRVALDVVPEFVVRQDVYESLSWSAFEEEFDDITSRAYSVSMFTDWTHRGLRQVWLKTRPGADPEPPTTLHGATCATGPRNPLPGVAADSCTDQLGVPGPSGDRLPHFRMEFTPSNGDELQSEYLIPRRHVHEATRLLRAMSDRITPLVQIAEIRTVAADDLWLSPCFGRETVGLHFTWEPRQPEVEAVLPAIEAALAPLEARPHWGKLFTAAGLDLDLLYPRARQFRDLAARLDPEGLFHNDFLDRHVFHSAARQ